MPHGSLTTLMPSARRSLTMPVPNAGVFTTICLCCDDARKDELIAAESASVGQAKRCKSVIGTTRNHDVAVSCDASAEFDSQWIS